MEPSWEPSFSGEPAVENRPSQKETIYNTPTIHVLGAKMLVSGRVRPRKSNISNMIHLKITGWLIGILPMVYEIIPTQLGSVLSPIYPKQPEALFHCSPENHQIM